MRTIVFFILFLLGFIHCEAQVYLTNTAKVQFFSETPVQNITATNSSVGSLINTANDSVFVRMKNTAFVFPNALMQEHFNENYMESTKYPYDMFSGKLNQRIDFNKNGTYNVSATGKITIHGVDRIITINGRLTVNGDAILLESEFMVGTADFHIEIPKLVFEKIAESIKVDMHANYRSVKS